MSLTVGCGFTGQFPKFCGSKSLAKKKFSSACCQLHQRQLLQVGPPKNPTKKLQFCDSLVLSALDATFASQATKASHIIRIIRNKIFQPHQSDPTFGSLFWEERPAKREDFGRFKKQRHNPKELKLLNGFILCKTSSLPRHPVIFSDNHWDVQSPQQDVFRFHYHFQQVTKMIGFLGSIDSDFLLELVTDAYSWFLIRRCFDGDWLISTGVLTGNLTSWKTLPLPPRRANDLWFFCSTVQRQTTNSLMWTFHSLSLQTLVQSDNNFFCSKVLRLLHWKFFWMLTSKFIFPLPPGRKTNHTPSKKLNCF